MRDALHEFRSFNRGFARRNPELIRYKIARMAESPFAFFRGSFHLFARDILTTGGGSLPLFEGRGVEMDLVGDVHSENFGTFKATDGLVHYDVNDFDETTTGRFDFDIARLTTSFFLAARDRGDALADAVGTALAGVSAYTAALRRLLSKSKPADLDVRADVPSGCRALDGLMRSAAEARRPAFIGKLTEYRGGKRSLLRSAKAFNLADAEREQAVRLVAAYRHSHAGLEEDDAFFAVEDACGRVSGIGSMGRLRYLVLLAGRGSAQAGNVLLEFKEALPSAYDLYRKREADEEARVRRAERVLAVQRASQAASNRYASYAVDGGMSFQVRHLSPHNTRVEARSLGTGALREVARVQAEVLARVHARAAARAVGPANPLAELADPEAFCQRVLAFALGYADLVHRDFARFAGARQELDRVERWMGGPA